MMKKFIFLILLSVIAIKVKAIHPSLYVKDTDKASLLNKIETNDWARHGLENIKQSVDTFVNLHITDPQWILSRMSMYWKDGERYTQCYVKDEVWERGEGNAPVPTVRLPGMRIWNKYKILPLKDRTPYNETGDMLALDKDHPGDTILVPYRQTGHGVRANNNEIMNLAVKSAFLYWLTGEEKYARFSADIFNQWLIGTYYMKPVISQYKDGTPKKAYEPGGIIGYYDYEQIHDDLGYKGATIYDFLCDYLEKHTSDAIKATGKSVKEITGEVLKRFIDTGMVRGGKTGNWNVNGWNMMMRPILVLEGNSFYPDGKGREYYLKFFTEESTPYHDSMPDLLKTYDAVTGLWPESPGYGFGTISTLLEIGTMLRQFGIDVMKDSPQLQKAALAMLPWMDAKGNLIVFGDYRGGAADYNIFELLYDYYLSDGDKDNARKMAQVIINGIENGTYNRNADSWEKLVMFGNISDVDEPYMTDRASYSPFHRLAVVKTVGQPGLMSVLYGGREGSHLSRNGLALQLYGNGYALAPDAAAYESYWSDDYGYHQSATGANTILPGYQDGDIRIRNMEPSIPGDSFYVNEGVSPKFGMIDMEAAEKRRSVFNVSIDSINGYYVDIFCSPQIENDYIFHGVGTDLKIKSPEGTDFKECHLDSLPLPHHHKGYNYFSNPVKWSCQGDNMVAYWTIGDKAAKKVMKLWQPVFSGREYYSVEAPSTNYNPRLTPEGVSTGVMPTPVLIVRQNGEHVSDLPFISVIEPVRGEGIVKSIRIIESDSRHVVLKVNLKNGITDYILTSSDNSPISVDGIKMHAAAGIVRSVKGKANELYLVNGTHLSRDGVSISDKFPISAYIRKGSAPVKHKLNTSYNIQK